jgi:hypothetical protein
MIATMLLAAALVACSSTVPAVAEEVASDAATAPAEPALDITYSSLEEMVTAALDALEREDADALRRLAITRDEFDRVVWPGLEVAQLDPPWPQDFVWSQHEMRHENGLRRALKLFGGHQLDYRGLEFTGTTSEHDTGNGSYTIHRDSLLELATADGETVTARIFGSVIVVGGRYKIYSFIVD